MDKNTAYLVDGNGGTEGSPEHDSVDTAPVGHCDVESARKTAADFNAAFNALLNESEWSRRQLDERATRIADLDESLQQLSTALHAEIEKSQRLEHELSAQADSLATQLHELTAERDRLQQQYDAGLEASTALEHELEQLRERHRQACDGHASEKSSFEQQLEAARAAQAELEQSLREQEQHTAAAQESIAELGARIEQSQQEGAARERAAARAQANLEQANADLQSAQESYRELEEHARNLDNLNRALHDSSASEQNKSRKTIESRDREIETLRGKLEAQGAAQGDVSQLTTELQELRVRLADAEHQLCGMADLQLALTQAEEKLAGQAGDAGESATLRQEIERLQGELADAVTQRTRLDMLEAENAELRSALERLQAETPPQAPALQPAAGAEPDQAVAQPGYSGRREFTRMLESVLGADRDMERPAAVVYLLIDDFMQIRQEAGVLASENVVEEVCRMLDTACGDAEMLARFGDCTFAMLVHADDEAGIVQRAERMRADIEGRIFETGNSAVVATASVGIVHIHAEDGSVEAVITRANSACETARGCGGNQVQVHDHSVPVAQPAAVSGNEVEIVTDVLQENRLQIHYQPISTLMGNASGYYEVLVRVHDRDGNAIMPGEFFALAERAGLSFDVDCRIIESAIGILAGEKEQGTTLFVKLSRGSVANEELGMRVMKLLKQYKVRPERVVFEVTENSLRHDLRHVSALTRALHSIGCKVAIEHYAMTTQAQHLRHVHADYIKIDASLVQDLGESEDSMARIRSIVDIAHANGCKTIAEQVESPYSLTRLFSLGVDFAQGYFIQEPGASRGYDFGAPGAGSGREHDGGKAVFDIE